MTTDGRKEKQGRRPAREKVYDYVRRRVLNGELEGGSFIEEKAVSEAVGVSRTPVREAFYDLRNDHYITLNPGRGAVVRRITARELVEIYECRCVIENHAVRRICEERLELPGILDDLRKKMLETGENGDFARRAEFDQAFHRNIVAMIENAVLAELYDSLQIRQQRVAMAAIRAKPARAITIDREHQALLSALKDFDAEAASRIIADHLKLVPDVLSRLPI